MCFTHHEAEHLCPALHRWWDLLLCPHLLGLPGSHCLWEWRYSLPRDSEGGFQDG